LWSSGVRDRFLVATTWATMILGGMAMGADARPLDALRWEKRVIVMLADGGDDPALAEQEARLRAAAADLAERDVVLVTARGPVVSVDGNTDEAPTADELRDAYADSTSGFQVVLVGKDGAVKLRSAEPVAAGDLFALIDTMPMRRQEMWERE
jgi:hypothetical protein